MEVYTGRLDCILLIDDDRLSIFINKILIENSGLCNHVVRVHSAREGLDYLDESNKNPAEKPFPDMIFLDIGMPGISGEGFIDRYKEVKEQYRVKPVIILLTSFDDVEKIFDSSGFSDISDVYHKPLTKEMVIAGIDKYIINR